MKQAECILLWYMSDAVHVESALLFETPEQIFARVFSNLHPRTKLPELSVEFCAFGLTNRNTAKARIAVNTASTYAPTPAAEPSAPATQTLAAVVMPETCPRF